jgi:hypothetical protein
VSQANVERVIGKLMTDEAFRHRFLDDPESVLRELTGAGMALTPCELSGLASLDADWLARAAEAVDPRLQKSDLCGERS